MVTLSLKDGALVEPLQIQPMATLTGPVPFEVRDEFTVRFLNPANKVDAAGRFVLDLTPKAPTPLLTRLVLSVDLIGQAVSVEVDAADVKPY